MPGPDGTIRIATACAPPSYARVDAARMSVVRWLRMSEALAELGHRVDMIADAPVPTGKPPDERLRFVPWARARWEDYDVVKANYQIGFDAVTRRGAGDHPFLVTRLGAVVGARDDVPGVPYEGRERALLLEVQQRIHERSRYVVVLTEAERRLWEATHGARPMLLVPTGVDRHIPPPGRNPYAGWPERVAVFVSNLRGAARRYGAGGPGHGSLLSQRGLNERWQERLNDLGRRLRAKGIRLCTVGHGSHDRIDPEAVTVLGPIDNSRLWDYQRFAHVGLALAQGPDQMGESSKIHYYLRSGLPVVSERPIPNNDLLAEAGMGVVTEYGDEAALADAVEDVANRTWPREAAMELMARKYSWVERARTYDALFRREFGGDRSDARAPSATA